MNKQEEANAQNAGEESKAAPCTQEADFLRAPLRSSAPSAVKKNVGLLVVGCGNAMAGDDSAGVEVVTRLRAQTGDPSRFVVLPQPGVDLLDYLEGTDMALIVDAVSSGAPLGTVCLFKWNSGQQRWDRHPGLPAPDSRDADGQGGPSHLSISAHGWGLVETLALARALGRHLPPLFVLGIEAGNMTLGARRSTEVEQAIEAVAARFPEIEATLTEMNPQITQIPQIGALPPESLKSA